MGDWISIALATAVPIVLVGALVNRCMVTHVDEKSGKLLRGRGIGWQFIRFTVLIIAIPVTAILALNDALSGEAAAILAGAMGYAFGKVE